MDEILKGEEQEHANTTVTFDDHNIEVKDVSFGYHDGKEILHGVSLSIPQNGIGGTDVRGADQILVLDGGKIVQQDTHDELIKEDSIYAEFVGGKKETAGWKL